MFSRPVVQNGVSQVKRGLSFAQVFTAGIGPMWDQDFVAIRVMTGTLDFEIVTIDPKASGND